MQSIFNRIVVQVSIFYSHFCSCYVNLLTRVHIKIRHLPFGWQVEQNTCPQLVKQNCFLTSVALSEHELQCNHSAIVTWMSYRN